MANEYSTRRYRSWYAKLLCFYPKPYRERFGEGMEQTFNDLCRERKKAGEGLFAFSLWAFVETSAAISRERRTFVMKKNKNIIAIALATAFILLLLLLVSLISDEVVWDLADFAFVGALLVGTGLTIELATRKMGNFSYRAAVVIAVVTAFILVGVNAAVGIIGTEDESINLMYLGVLGVGFIGALIARFKPHGMSRVMFAMALALMLIAVIALITGMHQSPGSSVLEILIANGFWAAPFVGSALLFRKAARKQAAA
ncbi:hypothetical protein ACFLR7_01815 [Acidobacteriota bacterium]